MGAAVRVKDCVGKRAHHRQHGLVIITSVPKGSKTTLNFRVIQRGPGWDEATHSYRSVKRVVDNPDAGPGAKTIYFDRTHKDEYGVEDQCHIKDLQLCG